ncbi:major capsid protein [Dipodfec virus UOA04_Rod_715]|nr:major capsid protein [Dipodfec virus UOA04_Rod_715]
MSNYRRVSSDQNVHFSKALFSKAEHSRMSVSPIHLTTFNAGDIVPIYCREVLPDQDFDDFSIRFDIRQTTLLTPTMGTLEADFYAFFVPNRIVNDSWKQVEGENLSGSWTAPSIELAHLVQGRSGSPTGTQGSRQIPVGSVADYYGFPTQAPIPYSVLNRCHDLKFRGYVQIYNEYFRDQNYQPPIPMSTLNVYQGFFDHELGVSTGLAFNGPTSSTAQVTQDADKTDGSFSPGALGQALWGSGVPVPTSGVSTVTFTPPLLSSRFNALGKPLKANKMHDYFTSVLPSPQKSPSQILIPVDGSVNIPSLRVSTATGLSKLTSQPALTFSHSDGTFIPAGGSSLRIYSPSSTDAAPAYELGDTTGVLSSKTIFPQNLATLASSLTVDGLSVSVNDLRMAAATQQLYESLARGGSRYRSIINSLFGLSVDDPFSDIPQYLGHFRKDLDLYQTAQTSSSEESGTPQGNLAAFGYTSSFGKLFGHYKAYEHGYLHVFCVVRHRNVYSSYLAKDNFRLTLLDFYTPQLANISEQPVYTKEINPFLSDSSGVFGYQEAWAEYRFEPDVVSGYMRPGVSDSLALWNYADDFSSSLRISDGSWLKSNTEAVVNRTLAVTSSKAPQFKAAFQFVVNKTLPMPVYSVPGMDII